MSTQSDVPMKARRTLRRRIGKRLQGPWVKGQGHPKDKGLRRRLRHAIENQRGWWDWAVPVDALFGRDDCGNYSPPEPRSWYWFEEWQDGKQRLTIAKSYDEKCRIDAEVEMDRELWRGRWPQERRDAALAGPGAERDALHADRCPEPRYWHYFNVQDDGAVLIPGNQYGDKGGVNYGLSRSQARVLVRYVVVEWWIKSNWLGLRRWLWWKALHRRVDMRIPFRCNARPVKGSGGYDHWACHLPRRHDGDHRVHNYTWNAEGRTEYSPVDHAA